MASPNFTHVYSALIAVINTKLPAIIKLLIDRVLIQFQRAFKRNNKLVCMATTKMLAHLVNQQVVHELLALEMLTLFLTNPTEDSVEIAADFMIECG
jgi:pre-mRNA-splicing factor CWC22